MHRAVKVPECRGGPRPLVYVALPEEYGPWAEAEHLPTLKSAFQEICGRPAPLAPTAWGENAPRIALPLPQTVLALDPRIPSSHQELRILLENTRQKDKVILFVDGEPLEDVTGETVARWPLARGEHLLELITPRTTHAVRFTVL